MLCIHLVITSLQPCLLQGCIFLLQPYMVVVRLLQSNIWELSTCSFTIQNIISINGCLKCILSRCSFSHSSQFPRPLCITRVYNVLVLIIAFAMLQWITNRMSGKFPTFVGFIIAEYTFAYLYN